MKIAALILTVFAVAAIAPVGSADGDTHNYIAGDGYLGLAGTWCEGGHSRGYTPQGEIGQYGEDDPLADPQAFANATESWLWSGEPECAPLDLALGTEQNSAHGAIAQRYDPSVHSFMQVTVTDDTFDATAVDSWDYTVEGYTLGCGSVMVPLDPDAPRHWQSPVDDPEWFQWVFVYATYVDTETIEPCFGSTGSAAIVLT